MELFLNIIFEYTDVVLFFVLWLGIIFIYILRKKRQLEVEINRRKAKEEDDLARQSKGRLTSLDAMMGQEGSLAPTDTASLHSPQPMTHSTPRPYAAPEHSSSPAPVSKAQRPVPQQTTPEPAQQASCGDEAAALLTQYMSGDGGGVEEMERMLERDPNNLQLLDWLAFMYYSNNDITKAIQTYSRIIEIDPNNASQHYYLGNCFYKNNEAAKALTEWQTVITLKPNSKYARKAQERISKLGPQ